MRRIALLATTTAAGCLFAFPAYARAADEVAPAANVAAEQDEAEAATQGSAETQAEDENPPVGADGKARKEGDILVTGSRIPRNDVTSPSPVQVIPQEVFTVSADTNVVRYLNRLPAVTPGAAPTAPGFFGLAILDLRALGRFRTLTLVNGRRWINALSTGGSDVATIPPELIERVEILTGGASVTYGSDAIAGVVNFILKDHFNGVELTARTGVTGRGEGLGHRLALTAGSDFANGRGNAWVHASWDVTQMILGNDRPFMQEILANCGPGCLDPFRSSSTFSAVAPVAGSNGIFVNGELFNAGGGLNPLTFDNMFRPIAFSFVQQGGEKMQLNAGIEYELTDGVEFYADGVFSRSDIDFPQEPEGFTFTNFFPTAPTFNLSNPFIGPRTRAFFATRADANGNFTIPGLRRRFVEVGPLRQTSTRNNLRGVVGVRIDLPHNWELDTYGLYQESIYDVKIENAIDNQRFYQALDARPGPNGTVVCADPRFGCVPINIFAQGAITPEAAAFIRSSPDFRSTNYDAVVASTATGTLLDLPAGPVGASFGLEYRRAGAAELPGTEFLLGNSSRGRFAVLRGTNIFYEAFGEVAVPILADKPFFHSLRFEGGVRATKQVQGGTTFTWKALGEWSPIEHVKIRGGVQRAIRAASVFERFGEDLFFVSFVGDPCFTGARLTGQARDRCIANGVPAAVADAGATLPPGFQFRTRDVGFPGLEPEKATTYTIGIVFDSFLIPGLTAMADYYDIRLDNVIRRVGRGNIVNRCITGDISFCDLVRRDPQTGLILELENRFLNAGGARRRGVDVSVNYTTDVPAIIGESARLSLDVQGLYNLEAEAHGDTPGSSFDCVGLYGFNCGNPMPHWSSFSRATYTSGPATIAANWRWTGPATDDFATDPFVAPILARTTVPSVHIFDLSMAWKFGKRQEMFFGVENVFDKKPIILGDIADGVDYNTFPSYYDQVGRRFFAGIRIGI